MLFTRPAANGDLVSCHRNWHAESKAPVYVVTETDISDLDAFQKEYLPVVQPTIKAAGGRRVAAGQNIVVLEGPSPGTRVAINEFDSLEAVQAWRASADFKAAGRSATNTRNSALSLWRASPNSAQPRKAMSPPQKRGSSRTCSH